MLRKPLRGNVVAGRCVHTNVGLGSAELWRGGGLVGQGVEEQGGPGRELNAYERVLAEDRRVVREMLRVSVGGARAGLALAILVVALFAAVGGAVWALVVGGAVVFWFTAALILVVGGGRRGRAAVTRAYLLAFGWAGWL